MRFLRLWKSIHMVISKCSWCLRWTVLGTDSFCQSSMTSVFMSSILDHLLLYIRYPQAQHCCVSFIICAMTCHLHLKEGTQKRNLTLHLDYCLQLMFMEGVLWSRSSLSLRNLRTDCLRASKWWAITGGASVGRPGGHAPSHYYTIVPYPVYCMFPTQ